MIVISKKRLMAEPASLDALGNDEKAILAWINGNMGPTKLTVGGEGAQSVLSGRAARAMLSLIGRGLVQAEIVNNSGRVTYTATEAAAPLRGKVPLSFLEKHGRWPTTEKADQ